MFRSCTAAVLAATLGIAAVTGLAQAQNPTNGDNLIFRSIAGDSCVIHRYTTVNIASTFSPPDGVTEVEYLVVAGGGAGGWRGGDYNGAGGGGAGGLLTNVGAPLTLSGGSPYPVAVGAGGLPVSEDNGENGAPSSVFGFQAVGGGGGARFNNDGNDGGSGGGAAGRRYATSGNDGGEGEPGQGHKGGDRTALGTGDSSDYGGAGGGGAGAAGADNIASQDGQPGGAGVLNTITGEDIYYAGSGGGGRASGGQPGTGGSGGGGAGHSAGTDGLGGGGGGGSFHGSPSPGKGGSGVVVVRYRLDDVTGWNANGYYALPDQGKARTVLIEDNVAVQVSSGDEFSILPAGTLTVGNGASLAVRGTLNIGAVAVSLTGANASLDISGISAASQSVGSLAGVAGSSVALGGKNLNVGGTNASTTFAGSISGTGGSLAKSGAGTLTLSGNNTYTGETVVVAGTLMLDRSSGPAVQGDLIISGGNVIFNQDEQIADTASVTMTAGNLNSISAGPEGRRSNHTQTLAGLSVTGGAFLTGPGSSWTITGDGSFSRQDGNTMVVINSGAELSFGGLTLSDFNSGTVSSPNSFTLYGDNANNITPLWVGSGGLTLNASRILMHMGSGSNAGAALILGGDVTATSTSTLERNGSLTTSKRFVWLNTTAGPVARTFEVAGGGSLWIDAIVTDGQTSGGSPAAAGSIVKTGLGTLRLAAANTYTGTTTVLAGTLDVTGSLAKNTSADVLIASAGTAFDGSEPKLVRRVANNALLAGFGSKIVGEPRLAGFHTEAQLLAGENETGGPLEVGMAWRMFGEGEAQSTALYLRPVSDVLQLSGMADASEPTDPFVLQMTYDESLVSPAAERGLHLAWLDGTEWVDAVAGNSVTGAEAVECYRGSWSDFTSEYGSDLNMLLGSWGIDTDSAAVWAVLNHNSQFGVLVPEPSSLVLLAAGLLGLLAPCRRRRFRN
ncbi:MAG: autotransporter-associated beta strand repeat-containing protein [Thermoguttaceae bacterium]|jgi:autotransporter-associated beta strand protein|nr:autotransporter-associated beta strand repeat-containing protein [Thermoguttaceae bacterium]